MATQALLPAFSLATMAGETLAFPSGRRALIGFLKEDCPTCRLVAPLLARLHQAVASDVDFRIAGQTADGARTKRGSGAAHRAAP